MQSHNSYYFNGYKFSRELLLLLICGFGLSCSGQNNTKQNLPIENQIQISESAININTASVAELEKLPHVGAQTARKIIEHRERYGNFSRSEHLILVKGISDQRFREIKSLVKVE